MHRFNNFFQFSRSVSNRTNSFRQLSFISRNVSQFARNKFKTAAFFGVPLIGLTLCSINNDFHNFTLGVLGNAFSSIVQASPEELAKLFPPIEPYNTGKIKVSDIHEIYYEESGNPNGKPVVVLHGGPGAGSSPNLRRYFDPKVYRIIVFDQRGSGQSTPHSCLEENTTWDLVNDIEKIRNLLGIEKWMVFGGSWGSTLSLSYAIVHPERVTELVLRGIFMLRRHELEFFYQNGSSYIFPDEWEHYLSVIPENERHDLIAAYHKRLTSDNEEERATAAYAWTRWEMATSSLLVHENSIQRSNNFSFSMPFARIENHYFVNRGFFPSENFILDNIDRIRHIPAVIVQGRYDMVCPMKTAWDLHRAWPEADFEVIPDAGHSALEDGIVDGLIRATEKFKPNN